MIAPLQLGVFSIAVSLCHGYCQTDYLKPILKYGKPREYVCVDMYDGTIHRIGDSWETEKCMECTCNTMGQHCCARYGGPMKIEGCIAKVDKTTCKYKFYKEENPSEPCFEEGDEPLK